MSDGQEPVNFRRKQYVARNWFCLQLFHDLRLSKKAEKIQADKSKVIGEHQENRGIKEMSGFETLRLTQIRRKVRPCTLAGRTIAGDRVSHEESPDSAGFRRR